MTELFEVISKEEFESSEGDGRRLLGCDLPTPSEDNILVWCEFCKGHYNEYHFGDIDEPSR